MVERLDRDDQGHRRWRLCPPERQEAARLAYRDNRERRTLNKLKQLEVGEQANIAIELLSNDDVNRAVLAQLGRARSWRRARARARDVSEDVAAARRARREEIRRARKEADANLEYLHKLAQLRDLIDVLFVLNRQLDEERARLARGEQGRISTPSWLALARNVREVLEVGQVLFRDLADFVEEPMDSCPLCGERLHDVSLHLDEGYIEGDVVEEITEA